MKVYDLLAAALLWQTAVTVNIGAVATPEHLRFQRAVSVPRGATGLACVTLDADVLAHAGTAAHNDLRLYRSYPRREGEAEVPYVLTESGPEPVGNAPATIEHLQREGEALEFDLRMPPRPYSEVQLTLRAHDFVGTVVVTGDDGQGHRTAMGSFGIFDLSAERLGRWTVLPMAESSLPLLHVRLSLRSVSGVPVREPELSVVEGVAVPPSRERQTLYTPIAGTGAVQEANGVQTAVLQVAAHVPVERVRFLFAPGFAENFARQVRVTARPDRQPLNDAETLDAGRIEQVNLPSGDPGSNPIAVHETALEATVGATLGSDATVTVAVGERGQPSLPIRQVLLEMRERRLCFAVQPGADYALRYGDPALEAPLYADEPFSEGGAPPIAATLGPERRNPRWVQREDTRPYFDRHPELFWVLVLLSGGMMGGSALHLVQHREGRVRVEQRA